MLPESSQQTSKRRRLATLDEHARARVECIVREQLDLEVYQKQKEINTIAERLHHSEVLLGVLRSAIQSQQHSYEPSMENVADGLMSHMRRMAIASSYGHHTPHQRRRPMEGSDGSTGMRPRRSAVTPARYTAERAAPLYAQRADGTTVRIVCPYCRRDNFASVLGFINHSRREHGAEFASYAEAIGICGVVADGSGDGEDEMATSDQSAASRIKTMATKMRTESPRLNALMGRLDFNQRESVAHAMDFINRPSGTGQDSSDAESASSAESDVAYSKHPAKADRHTIDSTLLTQPAQDSRFHVIRRATFGNTSQYVEPTRRPDGQGNCTHQWTVFVRSTSSEHPVDEYIRKVRVLLHPSFRPDEIVDLFPPNFELTRWGWGEFPVRLQVFFRDKRNKPIDISFMLKLDGACAGTIVPGAEAPIDFELDRRGLSSGESMSAQHELERQAGHYPLPPENPVLCALFKALCRVYPLVLSDAIPDGCQVPEEPESILDLVPAAVTARWTWGVALTADVWRSLWPIGKRLSAEASRNRCLLSAIHSAVADRLDSVAAEDGYVQGGEGDKYTICTQPSDGLRSVAAALLDICGIEAKMAEPIITLIMASDNETRKEAIDLLLLWRNEHRAIRPIHADCRRSFSEKSFAWSLKRWLRHNGLVPTPVLSVEERTACGQYFGTSHGTVAARDGGTGSISSSSQPVLAGTTPDPEFALFRQEFFCGVCGTLCTHVKSSEAAASDGGNRTEIRASNALSEAPYCSQFCRDLGMARRTTVSRVGDVLSKLPPGWDHPDDEDDAEALLMVDDDEVACSAKTSANADKFRTIAAMLQHYHMQQQRMDDLEANGDGIEPNSTRAAVDVRNKDNECSDTADSLEIDWMWSAIRPLELSCAPASRLSADCSDRTGTTANSSASGGLVKLAGSTEESLEEALNQRLVVGRLLFGVTRMFLRDLIAAADQSLRRNGAARLAGRKTMSALTVEAEAGRRLLMLTPLHVLAAVQQDPESFDVCSNAYLADMP
ncbi:hypothetical protein H4R26_000583 [Coemansia thaxteri]|uniref:YEATS domain-containing protein n=1 Tax=Coemansia thaxteri TaxID=2663907 RepID=A0A9W8BJY1_9FUNG|nr:hypothetical protein H4R26_000583 [Coemansia thaxteri]KAJ2486228.1 hypothetical protein EV174_001248 [Coemansia sp. RSA 2320]